MYIKKRSKNQFEEQIQDEERRIKGPDNPGFRPQISQADFWRTAVVESKPDICSTEILEPNIDWFLSYSLWFTNPTKYYWKPSQHVSRNSTHTQDPQLKKLKTLIRDFILKIHSRTTQESLHQHLHGLINIRITCLLWG